MTQALGILALAALLLSGCSSPTAPLSPEETAFTQKWNEEQAKIDRALKNPSIVRLLKREKLKLRLVITDITDLKLRSAEIAAKSVQLMERRILEKPDEKEFLKQDIAGIQKDHDELVKTLDLFAAEKRPADQLLWVSPEKGETLYILVREGEIIRRGGYQSWIE